MITNNKKASKQLYKLSRHMFLDSISSYQGKTVAGLDKAISDLIHHLVMGLNDDLEDYYYLSPLDPGVGKTEAFVSVLKAWKALGFLPGGSALVAVSTRDEILSLIKRTGLDKADFACVTADHSINAMGSRDVGSAKVIFTTHKMIRSRSSGPSFEAASDFHYIGKPRTLRIWDEGFTVAESCVLTVDSLNILNAALRYVEPHLVGKIETVLDHIRTGKTGDLIIIPADVGKAALSAKGRARALRTPQSSTLEILAAVAGRGMILRSQGGRSDRVLVGASRSIPADFAPAIITDASGRVRGTYKALEAGAGGLKRLRYLTRDYSAVSVKVCTIKCGKTALGEDDRRDAILRAAAKPINAKPEEKWLLISYKADGGFDIDAELRHHVENPARLRFLNWGRHHGTNEFRDIKSIMIVGTYNYGSAAYEAIEMAASGLEATVVAPPSADFRSNEFQHNVLQAILRGNARNGPFMIAGDCKVYVFASPKADILTSLKATLPGCKAERWNALQKKPTGLGQSLIDAVDKIFSDPTIIEVPKGKVRTEAGISSRSNLKRLLDDFRVKDELLRLGVTTTTRSFIRIAP
jgi:hypothetical protein